MDNNKKIANNHNKSTIFTRYFLPKGLIFLVIITVISFSYPNFSLLEAQLDESFLNKSDILGDWHDIHGIGLFKINSSNTNDNSIYIATHTGMFSKQENSSWMKIGTDRSDLMGFVIDPTKGVMYSSGHPVNGGNLGFRMSLDGGQTWQIISTVTADPIDFHAMSISSVNSNILYGSPGGGYSLFITQDEGKTWSTITPIPSQIISIAADPLYANALYIGTRSGLFYSNDLGKNWEKIESEIIGNSIITGLGFNQDNELFAFIIPNTEESANNNQNGYIIKSDKLRNNWTKTNGQISNAGAMWKFISGPSGEMYTIVNQQTPHNDVASSVYKSTDNGDSWILIGTNRENMLPYK